VVLKERRIIFEGTLIEGSIQPMPVCFYYKNYFGAVKKKTWGDFVVGASSPISNFEF